MDLQYWKGHHILALRENLYYPAVIYEVDNASSQVFVEYKNGHGLVSVYYDACNFNVAFPGIISDIIPPYGDIANNMKVAIRVPYGSQPFDLFEPGFISSIIHECGQFLVRTYSGRENIVRPEDLRFLTYPWSHYSMYYLQRNVSYNKSNANFFQSQFPTLPNQYHQKEAFQPMQEVLPSSLPIYSEGPKQFSQLSANNFSGCQIVGKENIKSEISDYYNFNNFGADSPYPPVSDSEHINHWNSLNAFYEKNLSYNYPDVKDYESKQSIMPSTEAQCGSECKDHNCINSMPKPVANVTVPKNNVTTTEPRVKRKYTRRKNVVPKLPKESSFVPLDQQNSTKTRKSSGFFMFCKEYRDSVSASSYDQSASHVSQKLAEIWNLLPPNEKKNYQDKAKKFEREQLINAEWSRLNNSSNVMVPLTINTDYMPKSIQGNVKTEAPNSYSDDEPRLVIDESRLDEESEDNASPLFMPKNVFYTKETSKAFPDELNTFLREEDIRREEINSTLRVECDTTSNFENEQNLSDTKPKTLVGGTFFPPDFSVEKAQNEIDNDITILTEKVTKKLFDGRTETHTYKKNDLIIQLFKDNGYFPPDYTIEEFALKHRDIFVDQNRIKSNIKEARQRLLYREGSSYLPLSPQLREILNSVMNNEPPLTIPGCE